VAAHLVGQVGKADLMVAIGKSELPSGARMAKTRRTEHRLDWGRGQLESGPPSRAVVRHPRKLPARCLHAQGLSNARAREDRRAVDPCDAGRVEAGKGFGRAD